MLTVKWPDEKVKVLSLFPTQAKLCSDRLMEKLCSHNRRSLDLLSAKAYFYHSRVYELLDQLANIRR